MNDSTAPGKYGLVGILLPTSLRLFFSGHPTHQIISWALVIITIISFVLMVSFIIRYFRHIIPEKRKETA